MPPQNVVTRLEAVAVGLGSMAGELEKIYGEPTPNLPYWRDEIIDVIEKLKADASASSGATGTPP